MTTPARSMQFEDFALHLRPVFTEMETGQAVIVEWRGRRYRLAPEQSDAASADADPDEIRRAIRQSVGALRGVDTRKLLSDISGQREQDSHGRPRDA